MLRLLCVMAVIVLGASGVQAQAPTAEAMSAARNLVSTMKLADQYRALLPSILLRLRPVVTQDRPGLLYEIGSGLARLACNIEVALIDTEGQKAIDVFYLTAQGRKLTPQKQELLREVLLATLA